MSKATDGTLVGYLMSVSDDGAWLPVGWSPEDKDDMVVWAKNVRCVAKEGVRVRVQEVRTNPHGVGFVYTNVEV